MIEITNRQFGPVSLLIKSNRKVNSFTTLTVPGRGAGQNTRVIADEQMTEYIARAEHDFKLITTRRIGRK